jgi:hypothetical protein
MMGLLKTPMMWLNRLAGARPASVSMVGQSRCEMYLFNEEYNFPGLVSKLSKFKNLCTQWSAARYTTLS